MPTIARCERLRLSNIEGSCGALQQVQRIDTRLRLTWPTAKILLRSDSGFCRDHILSWCAAHGVDYLFGLAINQRLVRALTVALSEGYPFRALFAKICAHLQRLFVPVPAAG